MTRAIALTTALITGLALLVPELQAYRAEQHVLQANLLIDAALTGKLTDPDPMRAVSRLIAHAETAAQGLPGDPRPKLALGVGLLMQSRLDEAEQVLVTAIADGERPEFMVNYGRVLAARGDHVSARAAMLRAGWIAPGAIDTLPRAMREQLNEEILDYQRDFEAGTLTSPPPWPEPLVAKLSRPN